MKITVRYRCDKCNDSFAVYCGIPDHIDGCDKCIPPSRFVGVDGSILSYMCEGCGHITYTDAVSMIPAMATQQHGCGERCVPE